jgi:hypothetical protein
MTRNAMQLPCRDGLAEVAKMVETRRKIRSSDKAWKETGQIMVIVGQEMDSFKGVCSTDCIMPGLGVFSGGQ